MNQVAIQAMSLDDLRHEVGRRDLAIRLMASWEPRMDALEAEKQAFEEELRRRNSFFFKDGT